MHKFITLLPSNSRYERRQLTEEVKIIFKNSEGKKEEMTITIDTLLESTKDDLYEMLEEITPCASASCNSESQNFCDCGERFENYLIDEVLFAVSNSTETKQL